MDKLTCIKEIIHEHGNIYMPIYNDTSIDNIYELFVNNILFEPIHIVDYLYLGIYHSVIQTDPLLIKKYLKHAIKYDDIYALYSYCIFLRQTKNYDKQKNIY